MSVKIGLVGTGTVGGGCIDIIQKHAEGFKRHFGIDIARASPNRRRRMAFPTFSRWTTRTS